MVILGIATVNIRPVRFASISFAVLHTVAFLAFVAYFSEVNQRDGQAMLLWGYWLVVDFPVSLLVPLGWWIVSADSTLAHYWLYVVHGLFGAMWWYALPVVAFRAYSWIRLRVDSPKVPP